MLWSKKSFTLTQLLKYFVYVSLILAAFYAGSVVFSFFAFALTVRLLLTFLTKQASKVVACFLLLIALIPFLGGGYGALYHPYLDEPLPTLHDHLPEPLARVMANAYTLGSMPLELLGTLDRRQGDILFWQTSGRIHVRPWFFFVFWFLGFQGALLQCVKPGTTDTCPQRTLPSG